MLDRFDFNNNDMELLLLQDFSNNKRCKRSKVGSYVENTISSYGGSDFQSHFRLNRSSAENLLNLIYPALSKKDAAAGREPVSVEKTMLMSLWVLATNVSFRDVADRFGLAKGNAHNKFMQFISAVQYLGSRYISFPEGNNATRAVNKFETLRPNKPFPGVIGCIDGTHIPIPAPKCNKASYYNRKGFYSILLQVVCDADMKFTDIFCGWPGSTNDARMWKRSPLYEKLKSDEQFRANDYHLLGDCAYKVETFILSPYKDNGHLTQKQKRFNYRLSCIRVIVEQAIGLLKNRFRRLKCLDMSKVDAMGKVIYVACILHNFCIELGDELPGESIDPDTVDIVLEEGNDRPSNEGTAKRDAIADIFMSE
ncbi:uncharacterized protein [Periplaneta americana]|uniref:uncharacterized protein n=1 Tax=Periplaneta americana TaxID=6978 RepID=UPI0037E7EE0D